MSLLEKVRNFFYDDEYEDDVEIEKSHHKEKKELNKIRIKEKEEQPEKQNISERELFKAERTFNFPMDLDEEDNIPTRKQIKEEVEKEVEEEEVKVYKPKPVETKEVSYSGIRDYAKYEEKREEINAPKRFKPTPVISPIYGILDKNYKKEDVLMDVNQEKETPRKVDYDSVRKRAYGDIYKTEEESKGIFFNLDEEKKEEPEDFEEDNDDDVKIVYNDVTFDEEEEEKEDDENVTIGEKIEAYEKEQEDKDIDIDSVYEDDDQILSETKEQDLFNLIDNMYNSEDEEEEEEED